MDAKVIHRFIEIFSRQERYAWIREVNNPYQLIAIVVDMAYSHISSISGCYFDLIEMYDHL